MKIGMPMGGATPPVPPAKPDRDKDMLMAMGSKLMGGLAGGVASGLGSALGGAILGPPGAVAGGAVGNALGAVGGEGLAEGLGLTPEEEEQQTRLFRLGFDPSMRMRG